MPYKLNPITGKLDYYQSGGADTFIELTDVPNNYTGDASKFVKVKAAEDGLEFVAGASVAWGDVTGTLSAQTDLQTALDGKVDENGAITGATKTKITYDAKGLVTAGADATTADIADSLNKRYVTDANLTVIGNTSGTNTGDQTSIVGITGSLAEFNTALTGADFATGGGTVTGASSGTNTGDQTITLTGDVTGTGTGSFAATIANDAVTYAKIQDVTATDKLLGRSTAGAGVVEEIACTAAGRALLDDADASAQRTTLGLGTLATQSGTFSGTSSGTNTGDQDLSGLMVKASNLSDVANASTARTNLGVEIGVNVQAYDADLTDLAARWTPETTTVAANLSFYEATDNGANRVMLRGSAAVTANRVVTLPDATGTLVVGGGTASGTNTGDQTSIVGITGTKAQFDTAVTDGNILYVGDVTSNATHTGEVTGSGALTVDKTAITGKTLVTAVGTDYVLISDTSDSGNLKKALVSDFGAGGGANAALSNLASVAINTTLISDTYNTDALGSSAIGWSDLYLGNGAVVEFSSAASTPDVTITHSSNALTLGGGTLILPAVTTTVAPLKFATGGTLLTTAEDGAIELDDDCFYGTVDAGNRGVIPTEHFIRANATRTFTSNTNQQAIFDSPTNGRLTLETGTYFFDGLIAMTSMSITSGNGKFSIIGAGTATLNDILWQAYGGDVTAEAVSAAIGGSWHVIATQTAANITTAGAAAALCFLVKGTFTVTVAGTIIPSFAQTTAAAAIVSIGSYFKCNRVGGTSVVSVGQWD